jgi:hypothetical protein
MSPELIALIASSAFIFIAIASIIFRRVPKKLKADVFIPRWREIQGYCKDKQQWPQALTEADKLLDMALKKRKLKGKSMGERMVSAQRLFTNNDGVWFAHNLYKKILSDPSTRLKEADMKAALIGFRQALKDLGALQTADESARKAEEA